MALLGNFQGLTGDTGRGRVVKNCEIGNNFGGLKDDDSLVRMRHVLSVSVVIDKSNDSILIFSLIYS